MRIWMGKTVQWSQELDIINIWNLLSFAFSLFFHVQSWHSLQILCSFICCCWITNKKLIPPWFQQSDVFIGQSPTGKVSTALYGFQAFWKRFFLQHCWHFFIFFPGKHLFIWILKKGSVSFLFSFFKRIERKRQNEWNEFTNSVIKPVKCDKEKTLKIISLFEFM